MIESLCLFARSRRAILSSALLISAAALMVGAVSVSNISNISGKPASTWRSHEAPRTTSGPTIYLSDPQPLAVTQAGDRSIVGAFDDGSAEPLSISSADLDADGVQDLVVGYSNREGGILTIHRGNLDAFAPQSRESFEAIGRGEFPAPFLPEAKLIVVPVHPDFVAEGTYNPYGYRDLIVAARGDSSIYLLSNDGNVNFSAPKKIDVGGAISSLAVGEFGKSGAFSKLLVGVCDDKGASLRVYEGALNGLGDQTAISLTAPATNLVLNELGRGRDAFFISNDTVVILRSGSMELETVPLGKNVNGFALGSFIYDRNGGEQIALLQSDGSINIAAHREFDPRVLTNAEIAANRKAALNWRSSPLVSSRAVSTQGWKIVEHIAATASASVEQRPVFLRTRVSDHRADDLMMLSPKAGQLMVVFHPDGQPGDSTFLPARISTRAYTGSAMAALSMRVNIDGRPGVMALNQGELAPSVMMPLPDPTFFPNRFDDPVPTSPITNACNNVSNADLSSSCSLREAVLRANASAGTDTIQLAAGNYTLTRGRSGPTPAYDAVTGTLNINDSVNIVGTTDGSGNPTSHITWGTLTSGVSVDMIMAVNEDIPSPTAASASISNVIFENGVNHGNNTQQDGDGGCMEFDTGTNGTATLNLTNVIIQNCATTVGGGGGIVTFDFVVRPGTGTVTISNSTIQNNSVSHGTAGAEGGGLAISAGTLATITNCKVLNNNAILVAGGQAGQGGGLALDASGAGSGFGSTTIHNSTISGNSAAGLGGGIADAGMSLIVDQGTVISGNHSGLGNVVNAQDGGGVYVNTFATGCPSSCPNTVSFNKVAITGNTTTGNGGGISTGNAGAFPAAGPLTIAFSRLAGNSATGVGSNLKNGGTTVTATNNWWGTNAAATTINTSGGGGTTFDPFIVLTHTASPSKIKINQSTTLTADMSKDNHGSGAALTGNLDRILGIPITFNNAVDGSISGAQTAIQNTATATATFNAGNVAGGGKADAVVDQATVTASIVVLQPPSMTKGFNPTRIAINSGVSTMTLTVTNPNVVTIDSSFTDTFPSGMVVAAAPNTSNTCGGTFTPVAGASSVSFSNAALPVGTCTVTVDVKGTSEGTLTNSVTINSSDAGNGNTPSASLTVYVPPVLAITKSHTGTFTQGQTATWTLQVANNSSSTTGVTDGTTVTVSDTLPSGYTLQSGTGTGWSCSGTATVTCTSTAVVAGNGGAFNPITLTVNVPADSPTSIQNTAKVFGGGDLIHTNSANAATGSDTVTVIQVPASITINAGATQQTPVTQSFGTALAVTVKDAGGVVIPNYSSVVFTATTGANGQSGTFTSNNSGTKSLVTDGSGIANAGVFAANTHAGSYTVGVTAGPAPPASFGLTNTPASANHFTVSAPASATAGNAINLTVTAQDQFGNTDTNYTGTVHFTKSDSGAGSAIPADYTFVAGDNGVHTFTNGVTFVTAGNQTVTATQGSLTGTSNNVAVSAASATHFTVTSPASATAGNAFSSTVTALDQFNNIATGYTGTVHFTKTDSGTGSALPANYSFIAGDSGVHTFTNGVTLVTAGNQTVTTTDTVTMSITGTSNVVTVGAATATHFALSAPASVTAGVPFNLTVTALDQFNNVDTNFMAPDHFTSSDGAAVLPGDYTYTGGDAGVHTFSITLRTAGNQTITATDTNNNSINGISNNISVVPGAATHYTLSAPASATAGSAFNFTVTAQDQFNNTATSYAGTVHFTSSDGQAVLPANAPLTNGAGTFSATLKTAGNQTINSADTASSSVNGASGPINVSAASATHFAVSAPPSVSANSAFNFSVTAQDQFNNTATGYAGTVHFKSSDAQAVLPADVTLTSGTKTLSATLKTTGNQTLTATDTTTSSITGTSATISVGAAATPTPTPTATATATATPTATATATATASPSATATPTATPTPTPAQALNLATRLRVDVGDKVMIGGFIIRGNAPKLVVVRGLGPSLVNMGVPTASVLNDPVIELHGPNGALITSNDNWKDSPQRAQIEGTVFQPTDDHESVILATLPPAAYTVVISGVGNTTGIGVIEIYDNNQAADSDLANISTRGFVQTGNDVLIGGFTLGGSNNPTNMVVRALGPSLASFGLSNLLADPTLDLHNANGTIMASNDDWQSDPVSAAQLIANGLAPSNPKEAAIFTPLAPPGQFTAVVAGKNGGVGIGIVEIYNIR